MLERLHCLPIHLELPRPLIRLIRLDVIRRDALPRRALVHDIGPQAVLDAPAPDPRTRMERLVPVDERTPHERLDSKQHALGTRERRAVGRSWRDCS